MNEGFFIIEMSLLSELKDLEYGLLAQLLKADYNKTNKFLLYLSLT